MSDMLRKLNSLTRKANAKNKELILEVDLILNEDHYKWDWNEDNWKQYIEYEEQKGNKVIYLCDKFKSQQKEYIEQYEQLEFEFEELEEMEQSMDSDKEA